MVLASGVLLIFINMYKQFSDEYKFFAFFVALSAGFLLNIFSLVIADGKPNTILIFNNLLMAMVAFYSIPYFILVREKVKNDLYRLICILLMAAYFMLFDVISGIIAITVIYILFYQYGKVVKMDYMDPDLNKSPITVLRESGLNLSYPAIGGVVYITYTLYSRWFL